MRYTFKDKKYFNSNFNGGAAIHRVESEIRVDNQNGEELRIEMTMCGQTSPSYNRVLFIESSKEVTCKKCLKRMGE